MHPSAPAPGFRAGRRHARTASGRESLSQPHPVRAAGCRMVPIRVATQRVRSMKSIHIAKRRIAPDCPPYIVAEHSANHNGKLETALRLIEEAAKSGADAVKLQTYRPDTIAL